MCQAAAGISQRTRNHQLKSGKESLVSQHFIQLYFIQLYSQTATNTLFVSCFKKLYSDQIQKIRQSSPLSYIKKEYFKILYTVKHFECPLHVKPYHKRDWFFFLYKMNSNNSKYVWGDKGKGFSFFGFHSLLLLSASSHKMTFDIFTNCKARITQTVANNTNMQAIQSNPPQRIELYLYCAYWSPQHTRCSFRRDRRVSFLCSCGSFAFLFFHFFRCPASDAGSWGSVTF